MAFGMVGVLHLIGGQVRLTPSVALTMSLFPGVSTHCFRLLRVLSVCHVCQVQNCRDLGATVHLQGAHIGEARDIANAIAFFIAHECHQSHPNNIGKGSQGEH